MARDISEFHRSIHDPQHYLPPPIQVRYFYTSLIQIDDPLSPIPPPSTTGTTPATQTPCPFSEHDNALLETAWTSLRQEEQKQRQQLDIKQGAMRKPKLDGLFASTRVSSEKPRQRSGSRVDKLRLGGSGLKDGAFAGTDQPTELQPGRSIPSSAGLGKDSNGLANAVMHTQMELQTSTSGNAVSEYEPREAPEGESRFVSKRSSIEFDGNVEGTTGTPFIRAPVRSEPNKTRPYHDSKLQEPEMKTHQLDESVAEGLEENTSLQNEKSAIAKVPVGVSRLHQVCLPELKMEPIYWSPVNDISTVIRGTWFYKDSMFPVENDVANLLEAGYTTMKPWTETWNDELNSAVEVGAIGEMKITHTLWPVIPEEKLDSRPGTSTGSISNTLDKDDTSTRRTEQLNQAYRIIDSSVDGRNIDNKAAGECLFGRDGRTRSYQQSAVIYANATEAYILRPNLQPSEYYGRRPLANYIRKGHKIGICVVRGFSQRTWDIIRNPKRAASNDTKQNISDNPKSHHAAEDWIRADMSISSAQKQVTDLILVIHGIGQKLSERVESFHFTHAMNTFRREVFVELASQNVKPHMREEMGGIMLLPVNWRSTLSFDEGGYRDGPEVAQSNNYSLKDITPETLPSVRNVISDVMLDIPYYLSHHQPRMISAVVKEANRIYRLWCRNNPGFEDHGRIHIMAHSLGTVMALDILSKQPTTVNGFEDTLNPTNFSFNTFNLYFCGSPAGFFLLLKKAGLVPRKDREKSCEEDSSTTPGVGENQGTYGCLPVENIYNIINPYDPVAYRMNATIDADYSASLKPAFLPVAQTSWFSFRGAFPRTSTSTSSAAATKRPSPTHRLPSTVELETHNFTREEIAEKRAYMLNDNGQVDYFIHYGGGPLDIQYLTMLSAHSSYWTLKDFVRFIVIETGRSPGKKGTLPAMRVVKKKKLQT